MHVIALVATSSLMDASDQVLLRAESVVVRKRRRGRVLALGSRRKCAAQPHQVCAAVIGLDWDVCVLVCAHSPGSAGKRVKP